MTRAEESALIFKILDGDKNLFRQIVDAHGGMILAMLYRMTGSREDAEDMAQETFVKAYFSLGKKRLTVSREKFTDKELQQSSTWLESGEDTEFKELRERQYAALEKAVAALEPQDRFLITAFYEQDRSLTELTQITGMSLSNVKVRLFRCRNRLARILKENKDLEK